MGYTSRERLIWNILRLRRNAGFSWDMCDGYLNLDRGESRNMVVITNEKFNSGGRDGAKTPGFCLSGVET